MKKTKLEQALTVATLVCDQDTPQEKINALRDELAELSADSLACLYGIAGVFCGALKSKLPKKCKDFLAVELITAFAHFTGRGGKEKPIMDYMHGF